MNSKYWYYRFCEKLIEDPDFVFMESYSKNGALYCYYTLKLYLQAIGNDNALYISKDLMVRKTEINLLARKLNCDIDTLLETIKMAVDFNIIKEEETQDRIRLICHKLDGFVGSRTTKSDNRVLSQINATKELEEAKTKEKVYGECANVILTENQYQELTRKAKDIKSIIKRYSLLKEIRELEGDDYIALLEMIEEE